MGPRRTRMQEAIRDPLPGLREQLRNDYGDILHPKRIDRVAEQALGEFEDARSGSSFRSWRGAARVSSSVGPPEPVVGA